MDMTNHKIVIGDSRAMEEINDQSVHLIITSPPYWQLKDYGHQKQIGFDNSYEDYINNLNLVWTECFRVLHPGCRLCINIGDQFARSVYYGRYKVIPIRTEIIKFCEAIGMDYMGAIIWQKVTTTNTTGGATIMGSFPYPRNGILKIDYEFILIFKKLGKSPKPTKEQKEQSKLSINEWNEYFAGHWNFNGERQEKHLAMFPEELPKRLIKMFSFVDDTVLDPFMGSGTTALAAMNLGRNSIGYEINREFLPFIKEKINYKRLELFHSKYNVEIIEKKNNDVDLAARVKQLPYIFRDIHATDKKIDPRKLGFGSKITGKEKGKSDSVKIKRIIDSEHIESDTGLSIGFLGIKVPTNQTQNALTYLNSNLLNKKVLLKFGEAKFDENDNLCAYVYLQNKTFINAKMIKMGIALPDGHIDHKYSAKFSSYFLGEKHHA